MLIFFVFVTKKCYIVHFIHFKDEFVRFSWTLNLFKKGRKRDLEIDDLYTTLDEHTSSTLGNELEK